MEYIYLIVEKYTERYETGINQDTHIEINKETIFGAFNHKDNAVRFINTNEDEDFHIKKVKIWDISRKGDEK